MELVFYESQKLSEPITLSGIGAPSVYLEIAVCARIRAKSSTRRTNETTKISSIEITKQEFAKLNKETGMQNL